MNLLLKEKLVRQFFGGGDLFGGGGGDSNTAAGTTARMDEYIAATQADNAALIAEIAALSSTMKTAISGYGKDYLNQMSAAETEALGRLEKANQYLSDTANASSATFTKDVTAALNDLTAASTLLDDQERSQITGRLDQYKAEAEKIDADLKKTTDTAIALADTDAKAATDSFARDSTSLGDTFNAATGAAMSDYLSTMGEAASLTPERLNIFTQAADYLSKAAQQTRMSLIDAADPNYRAMRDQVDAITMANLDGRIDAGTAANLARSAAFKSVSGGFSGGEMQRNLEARDLGLTALDLQTRGMANFASESQRRFNTEVSGLQADSTALLRDNQSILQNQANTALLSRNQTAESDRNQRQTSLNTVLGADLSRINTRRADQLTSANTLSSLASTRARDIFGLDMASIGDYYANRRNLANTQFNTNTGLASSLFNTNINTAGTLYGTNVNFANTLFGTQANSLGTVYNVNTAAETQAALFNSQAQLQASQNLAAVRAGANSAIESAYQQDAMINQQNAANQNALWGSLINTGLTAAGAAIGGAKTGSGSLMSGMLGNMFGSSYESIYGSATGGNTGLSTPTGWDNWSYGV